MPDPQMIAPPPEVPAVSVITPTLADPSRHAWLTELHDSLELNEAAWEWVVVTDGAPNHTLPRRLRYDRRVRIISLPRRCGAAAARNIGLDQSRAPWITSCDDDDVLPPGALDVRLAAVDDAIGWVGAKLAELFEDTGGLVRWDHPSPSGRLSPGEVWASWTHPSGDVPLGPTTLLVRRTLLQAVGGWQGLPQAEDLGMAMAVTSRAPGVMLDEVVYHYRKHTGMLRRSVGFELLEASSLAAAHQRGRAILTNGAH